MWTCPKCGATNFAIGPCECCGYSGIQYTIKPYTQEPKGTDKPLPKQPEYIC